MKAQHTAIPFYWNLPVIECECGQRFVLLAVIGDQQHPAVLLQEPNQAYGLYCPYCGKFGKRDA